ncbi:hypothetical protein HOLleu_36808 [Holothuria leucospilota]|uniref:Uncharacterized protein n=1 Tax=Holothuria leucospilota TaxID=206669 RepID=A0A9Q0YKK4_HOLLE|nr:hypothetical protein HOLleu_36808 [Holothuria leucospilota]
MRGFVPIPRSYHFGCGNSRGGNSMNITPYLYQTQPLRSMKGLSKNRTHIPERPRSGIKHCKNLLQMCNDYLTTIPNACSFDGNIKTLFSDWNWTAMLRTMA